MYLKFGDEFESRVITQGEFENRSIEQTLEIGWNTLKQLPRSELLRVTNEEIEKYLG
jgi:V/A-type H+/Na+-transporting ATPase subunit B